MIIGVISDTHFSDLPAARRLLEPLMRGPFADADIVLHAGDVGPPEALFCFAPLPVYAVGGNTEGPHPDLPDQRVLTLDGVRIGLTHGWGPSSGLEERVCGVFPESSVDLLVFGHSHLPVYTRTGGLVLFNPGSACRPRSSAGPTVGRLRLENGHIEGEILPLKDLT